MKALSRSLRLEVSGAVTLLGVLLAGLATPMRCDAQAVQPREALEDAKLYFTAPLRWDTHDWLEFGGTLVAFGVAHEFDDDVRTHFVGTSANGLNGQDSNSAQDALDMVLVNKLVPLDKLEGTTVAWCKKVQEKSPLSIRMLKSSFNAELDGQAGIQELAGNATLLYYLSDEAKEGRNAFLEKRKPNLGEDQWIS